MFTHTDLQFYLKINLKCIKQQWNIMELQSVMRKNGNYIVLQIHQNKFWTRPENQTIFRSDSVTVHIHYIGITSVADFWSHYYKTAQPRTQALKHRNSTVGQSGRQKHVWYSNFYLLKVKINSTAKILTQVFFLHWSHPDLFPLVSGSFSSYNNINLNKPNICYSDSNLWLVEHK